MSDRPEIRGKNGTFLGYGDASGPPSVSDVTLGAFADEATTVEVSPLASGPGAGPACTASVTVSVGNAGGAAGVPSLSVGVPPPSAVDPSLSAVDPRKATKGPPAVDIDLVYERRTAPLPDQPWVFLEVWTRNTIYQLDASLVCIDVIAQGTRKSIVGHPLRQARMVGGQSRDGETMELSHPFPRPGSEAVFEQTTGRHVRFSQTSSVTRVVMRLRVLTVEPEQLLPTWEDVSGKWDAASLRGK